MASCSEILPHLYLGNISFANSLDLLQKHDFTHVLNLTRHHIDSEVRDALVYKHIKVKDNTRSSISHVFENAFEFLDEAEQEGGRALLHCRAGVSRSTTVCCAYLMYKKGMSLADAYNLCRERRQVAHPNAGFIAQLQRFEMETLGVKQPSLTYDDMTHSVYERIIQLGLHDPLPNNDLLKVVEKACRDAYKDHYGTECVDCSLDAGFSGSMGLHCVQLYTEEEFESVIDDTLRTTIKEGMRQQRVYRY
eukprot:TRINITY_DN4365_c0_g2_i2.p1 TRINITY_DN4365_c0_g2~~TRINITY_DN4365_c0_g2_i2.p1  ORF type:complete len:287 (-),score=55.44 TRINITY_DN4365_c0_g2_i2:599-1345(-)